MINGPQIGDIVTSLHYNVTGEYVYHHPTVGALLRTTGYSCSGWYTSSDNSLISPRELTAMGFADDDTFWWAGSERNLKILKAGPRTPREIVSNALLRELGV